MRLSLPLIAVALLYICSSDIIGATMYLDELSLQPGIRRYRITQITAQMGEYKAVTNYGGTFTGVTLYTSSGVWTCGTRYDNKYCLDGVRPEGRIDCQGPGAAVLDVQRFVGLGVVTTGPAPPYNWGHSCANSGQFGYNLLFGDIVINPARVSCTGTTTEIVMTGRVGEKLTDTDNVYIHCDSEASLRLSIPDAGRVQVGGGGEVQLKFPSTGEAVLNVTGTDPLVRIDGELTKSPTTAGTYRGSTVLRIDVL